MFLKELRRPMPYGIIVPPRPSGEDGSPMEIKKVETDKKRYLDLLLLADEQEDMVDRYLECGIMYVLEDDGVKAECVVTDEGDGVLELKNLAVTPAFQGRGYGKAMVDFLIRDSKDGFRKGLQNILQDIVKKHKRIIFNGDGYKDDWTKEAARRGLLNLRHTPEALKPFIKKENIAIFERYGVFNSKTRVLEYASGGHPPAILIDSSGVKKLKTDGMVVGGFPGTEYKKASATVESGAKFFVFSDGVYEVEYADGSGMMSVDDFAEELKSDSGCQRKVEQMMRFSQSAQNRELFDDDFSLCEIIFR